MSVQVVESNRSGYKVVKSFGSSCDELELRSLERKAQQWIDNQRGPMLPFSWEKDGIEGHICICFTAYTILLELERRLKKAKVAFSLNQAREMTKNIYSITYTLPETQQERTTVLQMSDKQKLLVEIAQN